MRWHFKLMVVVVFGFVGLALATSRAQVPGGLGGFREMIGLKDGTSDPLGLLKRSDVKKELRIKEPQLTKVDAVVWEALATVLDPEQLKRLKQIDLQHRDYKAFGDPSVQDALKLKKDQRESMTMIVAESEKEEKALTDPKAGFSLVGLPGIPDKLKAISALAKERCTDVLTNEQKRIWQEMVGDEFKMDMPKMPDFGIPKADKKKAKAGKG